jgi:hypothetical protein
MDFALLIEHLADPRAYPDPTTKVDVHQTRISAVFVTATFPFLAFLQDHTPQRTP